MHACYVNSVPSEAWCARPEHTMDLGRCSADLCTSALHFRVDGIHSHGPV